MIKREEIALESIKRAVVTGPTGAVGTALVSELVSRGCMVYALCRPNSKRIKNIPQNDMIKIIECDISELGNAADMIGESCDALFHLAWRGTTGSSRNDMYLQTENIRYTLDAAELANTLGCRVFVGAGSQAEYGRAEGMLNSDTPVFPENGYGMAKLCSGEMSRIKCREYGIRHVWARILSVYGPCDFEGSMIMSTAQKLLRGEKPSLTKGGQKWDYLYSKDAAGILAGLAENGRDGKIYCVGSGTVRTLLDYVYEVRDKIDPDLPLGIGDIPYAENQVMYLCADTSDIVNDIGYEYKYTFEQGIAETIDWLRKID